MKRLYQLLHFIYLLGRKSNIITACVENNYIVYVNSKDKYYNLLPIKCHDIVFYKNSKEEYEPCIVLNILTDKLYYIQVNNSTNSTFFTRTITRDKLYPQIPSFIVKGYIKGIYFITT